MKAAFDDALTDGARAVLSMLQGLPGNPRGWLLRDLYGSLHLIIDDRGLTEAIEPPPPIGPIQSVHFYSSTFSEDDFAGVASRSIVTPEGAVELLEQTATGQGWVSQRSTDSRTRPTRIVMYSFKGGVGRTTTTALVAAQLSELGRRVLVVDFDLESPGLAEVLLRPEARQEAGLLDLLLADRADREALLRRCVIRSPLSDRESATGDIFVCPAGGTTSPGLNSYEYLPRLNRLYADLPDGETPGTFETRAMEVLDLLCDSQDPDVVLVDSRAGLHDLSAVAVTQFADLVLAFARNSPQHWAGYGALFSHWAEYPAVARSMREKLRVVSALTPIEGRSQYLGAFNDHAYNVFSLLYDELPASGADLEVAFHPQPEDRAAPHAPIVVTDLAQLSAADFLSGDADPFANDLVSNMAATITSEILALTPVAGTDEQGS